MVSTAIMTSQAPLSEVPSNEKVDATNVPEIPKEPQVKMLAKASSKTGMATRIVVGTPGRIIDLVNDCACDLSK